MALWCVPVPEIGGVARHVLDAASTGLPGWRLAVLCPEGELARRLRGTGAAVLTAPFGPAAGFPASVRALRRAVRTVRPEVVHTHLAYADVVGAAVLGPAVLLGRLRDRMRPARGPGSGRRRPLLVTTEHGIAPDDAVYQSSRLRARAINLVHTVRLRATDVRIAVSRSTARTMCAKWRTRDVQVVPHGVDVPSLRARFAAAREEPVPDAPRYLSLSRLAPEKNIALLLRAFALVLRERPRARLEIAGEGPSEAALRGLAAAWGIDHAVHFSGFRDPVAAMAGADVVVQLSAWENLSYTLLDAVAVGLPVVATDVGGNREIVSTEGLVPPDSSAETVAGRLLSVRGGSVPTVVPVRQMIGHTLSCYEEGR